jgi:Fungal specific transcription factor domain
VQDPAEGDFQQGRRTPNFDCSIPQLLSPVPYSPSLSGMQVHSGDPMPLISRESEFFSAEVLVKTEEQEEDSAGSLVRDLVPVRPVTKTEYINPQLTFMSDEVVKIIAQPLPILSPMLQRNPTFRQLFDHFILHTCSVLVPYDDVNNPFRTLLAQMALDPSAEHLLAALLASSAAHQAGMRNEQAPRYLVSHLLHTTLGGLRKALGNPSQASTDSTLATAIALSSYNIISSDVQHWRMHLDGAREIILHRRRTAPRPTHESTARAFLFKWFAYLDVIAGSSGLTLKEHNYDSAVSLIEDVTDTHRTTTWEPPKFDTFTGFTSRLLPLLLRIGKLAQQKRLARQMHIDVSDNETFLRNVRSLELDFETAELESLNFRVEGAIDPLLEDRLRACNDAFHAAARLHIQRRLHGLPQHTVSHTVAQIFSAIQRVPVGSGPAISLLYPIFSAGVECTQGEWRDYALYRMQEMEKLGIGNVQRAKKVMVETWKRGDEDGQTEWEDVMEQMGWDLSLA